MSTHTLPTTSLSSRPRLYSKTSPTNRFKVSCNSSSADDNPKLILPMQNVDRRNMLLGLGGLYGVANLTNVGSALAYPITAPDDISSCVAATDGVPDVANAVRGTACCPPSSQTTPVPYVLPPVDQLRVRPPADRLTPEYIEKYQEAMKAMKALPDDDPRSWKHQGKIHCAYCNGAYSQEMNGHPELKISVHNNSLFFPFHRWYMIADTTANPDAFFGTNPNPEGTSIFAGKVESGIHTAMHIWVGNPRMPNNEDMGNFYSAGYEPAFYLHHSNVDRIDCLDINKMGYTYEPSRLPWLQSRPIARVKASNVAAKSVGVVKKVEQLKFPVKLDQTLKVLVKRPATKRSKDKKKKANEMLFLEGIKYNGEQFFKFDVLVDDVPHGLGGGKMVMTSGAAFGLTQLLEDLEAEDDEYVLS
ncbi:hypothetical protein M8C21_021119 [Ambrosia artemisiifolia]|uniref:Uncharacterized protein n=1 Tax=Ambrosia artemisiifolia TaxID=4212 RepID=A0AAD5BVV2_AMBAR|nr:hypothetical protein M8C21_021119 [Ambrosia artemisiifolia]